MSHHHHAPAASKDPLSGHPGHLSPEQEQILAKFKEELKAEGYYDPEKHDDNTLLRFLRARKFDLPKAKIMWIDTQNWRKSFGVDELYETFEYKEKAEVDKYYPKFYHKTDKDGRPIYIEQLGKLDITKLYTVTTPERVLQSLVVEYERFQRERLPVCSEIQGQLIETSCTIMDLKGVGVSQFWKVKGYVQEASGISQNNYPESMGKFYIINAPWAFSTVWSLVKGWLDEATVAKIHILGSDYKKSLLEQVPADSLPAFLGGTCQCPEGCSLSDAGPWRGKETQRSRALSNATHRSSATHKSSATHRSGPAPAAVDDVTAKMQAAKLQEEVSKDTSALPAVGAVPAAQMAATSNGDLSKY